MSLTKLTRGTVTSKVPVRSVVAPVAPRAKAPASSFQAAKPTKVALQTPQQDAARRARQVLSASKPVGTQGTVVEDPTDVNDGNDVSGPRADAARAELAANLVAEGTALGALSSTDRTSYLALKRELQRGGDPVAGLALQTMLLEGCFTKHPQLLANLNGVLMQPLTPEIPRHILLPELVQELATPASMNQTSKGTCVPTSINMQLAMNDPAEYVRLISGLATPEGSVVTRGGDVLQREPGVFEDGTVRSIPQKLLAPALMELGNGAHEYDNATDTHTGQFLWFKQESHGLSAERTDRALESLYGRDFAYHSTNSERDRSRALDFVREQVGSGGSVLTAVRWGDGAHEVLVTGTETRDGVEHVRYQNPWGTIEVMPMDEFKARMLFINYEAKS